MTRRPPLPFLLLTAGVLLCAVERPVGAVSGSHDFTVWQALGEDVDRISPRLLRALLRGNDYTHVLTVSAQARQTPARVLEGATPDTSRLLRPADLDLLWAPTPAAPDAGLALRPGDIVLVGELHSGVVNSVGRIEHFVQDSSKGRASWRAEELAGLPNCHVGAGGWMLERLLSRATLGAETGADGDAVVSYAVTYPYLGVSVEVWRHSGAAPTLRPVAPTVRQLTAPPPRPAPEDQTQARPTRGDEQTAEEGTDPGDAKRSGRRGARAADEEPTDDSATDSANDTRPRRRSRARDEDPSSDTEGGAQSEKSPGRPALDEDSGGEPQEQDDARASDGSDRPQPDSEGDATAPDKTDDSRPRRERRRDTNENSPDNEE